MACVQSIVETELITHIDDNGNSTVVKPNNDTSKTINPDKDTKGTEDPVINISSGMADAITRATSNDGNGSINGTTVDLPISPSNKKEENLQNTHQVVDQENHAEDAITVEEPSSPVESMPDENDDSPAATQPAENDLVYPLTFGDINYKVIRLQKTHTTTESAATMCQNHHDKIGSLYSLSIPNFSSWFQRVHPMSKAIIGTWNGDSYGANGPQCLIYSGAQGVHLGACTDASVLLCESTEI
ncbi:unnamed protein product [Absidia cylindrospora]